MLVYRGMYVLLVMNTYTYIDCVPGRANATALASTHSGTVYGQCSEICGSLHGFMPLVVTWCSGLLSSVPLASLFLCVIDPML